MAIPMNSRPTKFREYEVRERRIELLGRQYSFIGPCDPEALLEAPGVGARFAADGYMPYWAEFWPASLLLMDVIAAWGRPADAAQVPKVVELGCGLGALSVVLASLGYQVIASDYDEDALAFTVENARLNGVTTLQTSLVDWRHIYPRLRADRIVAAEVLYERRNAQPVANFIRHHLAPKGFALICDRNRSTADDFSDVGRRTGLRVEVSAAERDGAEGERPIRGRLFRLDLSGL